MNENIAPITHVLLVTDRSGSMYKLAEDVRGGYNSYLDSLAAEGAGQYRITTVLFSDADRYRRLCTAVALADAPRLDEKNYAPGGMTALLDAIGKTITEFEGETTLNEGDRVLLVVQTDGRENASREYQREVIQQMISDREAGGKWGAIFMGAGPDTWTQAGGMGFSSSLSHAATSEGVQDSYAGLARASAAYAGGATGQVAAAASGLTVETE